jgi:hypothetical protein
MLHRILPGLVVCVGLTVSVTAAEEFASQLLKFAPGTWELKDANGALIGTVDWKLTSEGKAISATGKNPDSGVHVGAAGWDAGTKKWVHVIFYGDGAFMRYELDRFKDGVYSGTVYFADATGKTSTGKCQNKIIDNDHFEVTQVVFGESSVLHCFRKN